MVVLAAAAASKTGKVLFSRQFTEMSRIRIESLLSAFPKLIDVDSARTYVETDNVRYVYVAMEKLVVLLITNKSSNIVEDLDTLQLLSTIIKDKCQFITENEVIDKAFDLMFAFDEVISLGYRENLSLDQVNSLLEMDSHEENLANLITQSKIDNAREESKKNQKRIESEKKIHKNHGFKGGISSKDFQVSFGESSTSSGGGFRSSFGGLGSKNDNGGSRGNIGKDTSFGRSEGDVTKLPGNSLRLGVKNKKNQGGLLENLMKAEKVGSGTDDDISNLDVATEKSVTDGSSSQTTFSALHNTEKIVLKNEEELLVEMNRQGGLSFLELKGFLSLHVKDKESGYIRILMNSIPNDNGLNIIPQVHPNLDKKLFQNSHFLCLKQSDKAFPCNQDLKLLQWRGDHVGGGSGGDSSMLDLIPMTVSCWPSAMNGGEGGALMSCIVEYEVKSNFNNLLNVEFHIPFPQGLDCKVESADRGEYSIAKASSSKGNNHLVWTVDKIDAKHNRSGTIEFVITGKQTQQVDESIFFPLQVTYQLPPHDNNHSGIAVKEVQSTAAGGSVETSVPFFMEQVIAGSITVK